MADMGRAGLGSGLHLQHTDKGVRSPLRVQTSSNEHGREQARLGRQGVFSLDSVILHWAEAKIRNYQSFNLIQGNIY